MSADSPPLATSGQFFAAADLKTETVHLPGVGPMRVRGLTVAEWGEYQRAGLKTDAKGKVTFEPDVAKLVQLAVTGADGGPAFTPADLPKLRAAPHALVYPLADAARRLTVGDAEGDEGNSPGTPGSGAS